MPDSSLFSTAAAAAAAVAVVADVGDAAVAKETSRQV